MAETLSEGVTIPEGTDQISASGVEEMRTLGRTTNTALERKANKSDAFSKANPGPFDFDAFEQPGTYNLGAPFPEGWTNVPPGITTASVFTVYGSPNTAWCVQEIVQYGNTPKRLWRVARSTTAWNEWVDITDAVGYGAMASNAAWQTRFMNAVGGPVSTGGKGAFALRLDHGYTNIKTKILDGLRSRGIVPGIATNSRNWDREENSGVTTTEVNGWVANGWVEIINHGATHGGGLDDPGLIDEIVNGRLELESQLPAAAPIWAFAPPGVSEGWEGFNGGNMTGWTSTAAQIILQSHAYSMGYGTGAQRALDGTIRQAQTHITLDTADLAAARSQVDQAIASGAGIQFMLHPRELDAAGKITTADFLAFLDYVVAARDRGDLVILSPNQMIRADSRKTTPAAHTHPQSDIVGLGAALAAKLDREAIQLNAEDLNTVTTPGYYTRNSSSEATPERHYPVARAGRLEVQANAARSQVTQFYITFDATTNVKYFVRNMYLDTWSPWWEIPLATGGSVWQGVVASGTDVNTLRTPGFYSVPTTTVAGTLVNYPTNRAGIILVATNSGSSLTTQEVTAMVSTSAPAEKYYRATLSSNNTSWGPWSNQEWIKDTLNGSSTARVNVDTHRTPGAWAITNRTYVDGLPGSGTGILEVFTSPKYAMSMQRFTERVANDDVRVWVRYSLLVGGWAGIAWDEVGAQQAPPDPTASKVADVQVSDHATRVEYARSRRGGGTGTGGLPVFMWRFDHWLVAFRDKILPILQEFDLPATLNVNYDNLSNPQNGGGSITWTDVQAWNQYSGIEIANHGSTHTNVNTMASIYHEIVEGRRNLEAAMPLVAVETWQEHGSAYLVATDLPGDTGLDLGRSLEAFASSYAGRLVMAEHAVVEGKIGSFYPPLSGHPQIGQSHYSLDRDTASSAISTIQYAQKLGRGLTGYTHPGLMDQVNEGGSLYPATYNADGSVDYQGTAASSTHYATEAEFRTAMEAAGHIVHMPTKDFRAICEWLAAERDAGRIMVMTAAGGGFADKSHDRRENLLVSPDFSDTSVWGGSGGYTITGTGDAVTATSGAGAAPMTQGMLLYTRFGWAMGAAHELLVHVRAETPTTLTLGMEKLGDPATWKTEKTYDVPGGSVVRPYRLNLTLPRSSDITQMTVRLGGPNLTIVGQPLLAAI